MKIKNVSSKKIRINDMKHPTVFGVKIELKPNAEIVVFDEDAEKSEQLTNYLIAAVIIKTGDEEPNEVPGVDVELSEKIVTWVNSRDASIRFQKSGDDWDSVGGEFKTTGTSVDITVAVTDGDGAVNLFNQLETITVSSGGTATVTPATEQVVVNGTVTVTVTDSAAAGVSSLAVATSGDLDVSDVVDVNFSA